MKRLQAYLRLIESKRKNNDMETFANQLTASLFKKEYSDLEVAKILNLVNQKTLHIMEVRKKCNMNRALNSEEAHDILRNLNTIYH